MKNIKTHHGKDMFNKPKLMTPTNEQVLLLNPFLGVTLENQEAVENIVTNSLANRNERFED